MSSNVNCFIDISLISWFHDWCLNNALAFNSFRKRCFQLSYLLSMFSNVDDRSDIFWVRSFNLFDLSRSEDAWIPSFFLTSYFIRFLIMIIEAIFFKLIFFVKHSNWLDVVYFSFIIDCCRCVNLRSITQLHLSNVNIFFFQFIFELCNFNQDIPKMMSWVIISTISKINAFWWLRIVMIISAVFL